MEMKTKIYIVDDHQLFIDGLKALLSTRDDLEIVGSNLSAIEALQDIKSQTIEVLLTDINMPEMNGIELTELVKKYSPSTLVICLSMHKDMHHIDRMMKAGASAYLLKNTGVKELFLAIDSVLAGDTFYTAEVKDIIVNQYRETTINAPKLNNVGKEVILTKREKEIIRFVIKGNSSHEIAEILRLSYYTVTTHRRNIYTKLGFNKVSELAEYALIHNLND